MKKFSVVLAVFLLTGCGDAPMEEYKTLQAEAEATTAEAAKKQYDEVEAFVEKLKAAEADEEELPEGLLANAKTLQAQRAFRFGGLAAREKAVQYWEVVKGAFSSAGISMAEAVKQDPALEVITAREEPNDDWSSYR